MWWQYISSIWWGQQPASSSSIGIGEMLKLICFNIIIATMTMIIICNNIIWILELIFCVIRTDPWIWMWHRKITVRQSIYEVSLPSSSFSSVASWHFFYQQAIRMRLLMAIYCCSIAYSQTKKISLCMQNVGRRPQAAGNTTVLCIN